MGNFPAGERSIGTRSISFGPLRENIDHAFKFTLSCGLALSAAVDALIAGIIIFYLRKGQTGFKSYVTVVAECVQS